MKFSWLATFSVCAFACSTPGAEGQPCYGNGTCDAGLTCASDLCVFIAEGEGEGDTSEGEGDVVGEGEGDGAVEGEGEGEGDVGEGEGDPGEGEGEGDECFGDTFCADNEYCNFDVAVPTCAVGCRDNSGCIEPEACLAGHICATPPVAENVGTSCTYDPSVGADPSDQCVPGTKCVISTRDGRFNTLGLSLGFWEDQLTVADGDVDIGYCSPIGNGIAVAPCPFGTVRKFFTAPDARGGLASMCLRPCVNSGECGPDRVCDVRWADPQTTVDVAFCVAPCLADVSDCVRSGVIGASQTALSAADLGGASTCNISSGLCEPTTRVGSAPAGAACSAAGDCATGLACYQPELFADPPRAGFCARRCTTEAPAGVAATQGSCDDGEACQAGLAFGFTPSGTSQGMLTFDDASNLETQEGFCLSTCTEGVTLCAAGSTCGAADVTTTGELWNGAEMCVPPAIKAPG